ncbi:2OG-Fe(II) oxygenase [Nostoc sp. MG11]|uniref:2OG-Fe(II) oxygenase n=1 Tax=Nostoc sp. MG11 TaxID=2721166 RepID=UPI00186626A3|nr:2OG-Fe(II) oxygenase [Nostoc sp. MG11]
MNNIDNFDILKLNGINIIDNFLPESKCRNLLEESSLNLFWTTAKVALQHNTFSHHEYFSSHRKSQVLHECNFGYNLKNKTDSIKSLLHKKINVDLDKLENWQITKYEYGDFYNFHNDCGCWKDHPSGERKKTILIYLLSPQKGGETYFRALNHYVMPIQGRLVFWDNLLKNGNCNYAMIHASLQVKRGIKITLNTWIRQNSFINPI